MLKDAMQDSLLFEILSTGVKTAAWAVPALLWILLLSALSGGGHLLALTQGNLHINPDFSLKHHHWLLLVGITEELVFRGWLLNATARSGRDIRMIALNAVMFLCIHFPGWIQSGEFLSTITGYEFVSILLFSVLISICFLKHKNIVLPIFIHMLYDFVLKFWIIS